MPKMHPIREKNNKCQRTKVADPHAAGGGEQDVLRLEVPMGDVAVVEVLHPACLFFVVVCVVCALRIFLVRVT